MPGMAGMLRGEGRKRCNGCYFRDVYGAEASGQFGGVELCGGCRQMWQDYFDSLPTRVVAAFPILEGFLKKPAT